jgi:hypothetical protein
LRKLFIGALVGVLALAVASIAIAATQQHFKSAFLTKVKNKPTGIDFALSAEDPANAANNGQPKPSRRIDVKLPAGTVVDNAAAPLCKADDTAFQNGGEAVCSKSKVGSGSATAKLPFPGQPDIAVQVTAFNAKKGLVLYLRPSIGQPFTLRPKFTGNLNNGPTLVTTIPPNCLASTPKNGQCVQSDGQRGKEIILTSFALKTVPKTKGKHTLFRSPQTCKGTWKFTSIFHYADSTTESVNSLQACKK